MLCLISLVAGRWSWKDEKENDLVLHYIVSRPQRAVGPGDCFLSVFFAAAAAFTFYAILSEAKKKHSVCAIATCKSRECKEILFHRFPPNEETRKTWIVRCKRKDNVNPNSGRICSLHFEPGIVKIKV
jgi:hypothetical protein